MYMLLSSQKLRWKLRSMKIELFDQPFPQSYIIILDFCFVLFNLAYIDKLNERNSDMYIFLIFRSCMILDHHYKVTT